METTRRVIPEWYDERRHEADLDAIVVAALAGWKNDLDECGEQDAAAWGELLGKRLRKADGFFKTLHGGVVQAIDELAVESMSVEGRIGGSGNLRVSLPDDMSDSLDRAFDGVWMRVNAARERLRNSAVRMAHEAYGVVPVLAPFVPWRREGPAQQAVVPKSSHDAAARRFSWRTWLVVAGLFLVLSSIHVGAGHVSYNALVESIDSVKVEQERALARKGGGQEVKHEGGGAGGRVLHAPLEKELGFVFMVLLSAISYCASLYAIVRSKRHVLPRKDRQLARALGYAISGVLVILLVASCILLTHGQEFDRVMLAKCMGHLCSGIGLIAAFHVAEEMVMRFLGRYLRGRDR